MLNVTFNQDLNEYDQLWITLDMEVSDQILVFFHLSFMIDVNFIKKLLNGGEPAISVIFLFST